MPILEIPLQYTITHLEIKNLGGSAKNKQTKKSMQLTFA